MAKNDSDGVRTFICIELPETIKTRIDLLEKQLRNIDAQVSWINPSNVHLTLRFLGSVRPPKLDRIRAVVERAVTNTGPFEIQVEGVGCFPSERNPKVLWIGLTETPEALKELYDALEDGLARQGFPPEQRTFSPHLTIGRLRSPRNGQQLAQKLGELGFAPERFIAQEVILMRSDLKPSGSVYTPQFVIPILQRTE